MFWLMFAQSLAESSQASRASWRHVLFFLQCTSVSFCMVSPPSPLHVLS